MGTLNLTAVNLIEDLPLGFWSDVTSSMSRKQLHSLYDVSLRLRALVLHHERVNVYDSENIVDEYHTNNLGIYFLQQPSDMIIYDLYRTREEEILDMFEAYIDEHNLQTRIINEAANGRPYIHLTYFVKKFDHYDDYAANLRANIIYDDRSIDELALEYYGDDVNTVLSWGITLENIEGYRDEPYIDSYEKV